MKVGGYRKVNHQEMRNDLTCGRQGDMPMDGHGDKC